MVNNIGVLPGIEPGYIVLPSQKIIMYSSVWHAGIVYKIKEISSSALV
jgi:hypothetical protein